MICGACNADVSIRIPIINTKTAEIASICPVCCNYLRFNPDWIQHDAFYHGTDNINVVLKKED